jgi:hypothetical protein
MMLGLICFFYLKILNYSIFIAFNFIRTADALFNIFMLNHMFFVYMCAELTTDNHNNKNLLYIYATEALKSN